MNPRAPKTFVRVDIADATQDVLIEKKRFDACAPRMNAGVKFFLACFERIEAEFRQKSFARAICKYPNPSETPDVRVAKLAAVIEGEKQVSMWRNSSFRGTGQNLPRHAEVNLKKELYAAASRALEIQQEKLAEAVHRGDTAARQFPLDGRGIIDEISFPEAHAKDAPPRQHRSQSAGDSLDFRQLRHILSLTN